MVFFPSLVLMWFIWLQRRLARMIPDFILPSSLFIWGEKSHQSQTLIPLPLSLWTVFLFSLDACNPMTGFPPVPLGCINMTVTVCLSFLDSVGLLSKNYTSWDKLLLEPPSPAPPNASCADLDPSRFCLHLPLVVLWNLISKNELFSFYVLNMVGHSLPPSLSPSFSLSFERMCLRLSVCPSYSTLPPVNTFLK